jgi:hypothetical protein
MPKRLAKQPKWTCPKCHFDIQNHREQHLNSCNGLGPWRRREKIPKDYNLRRLDSNIDITCSYSCGKVAQYRTKNGKYCCESSSAKCEAIRQKNSKSVSAAHKRKPGNWAQGKLGGYVSIEWKEKNPGKYKASVEKQTETRKKRMVSGEIKPAWLGKHHKATTRETLSIKRIKYLETHHDHGLKWYTVGGKKVQGNYERRFAEMLESNKISWVRKRIIFQSVRRYTPDFYCPQQNVYFEIKGFLRDRDLYKMFLVLEENPQLHIKIISKEMMKHLETLDIFSVPDFQYVYKKEDINISSFVNQWD